ncbi:transposase [Candidatus Poribacteria bacterium]
MGDAAADIVRYIRHPAIANSRLVRYDGDEVTFWYEHKKERYTVVMKVLDFIESVIKHIPQKHQKLIRYYGLLSRRLRKWAEKVIGVWRHHEEMLLGRQLELFQKLLESKKEADKQRNRNRLQIICPKCASEMELLFIAYLKDNELWVIGGWRWLEQRLMYREMMQRERQKREEESAQLNFLSALGMAA